VPVPGAVAVENGRLEHGSREYSYVTSDEKGARISLSCSDARNKTFSRRMDETRSE
jgi:hypothetical protein